MNFSSFRTHVTENSESGRDNWIYRGQSNPQWGLITSYARFYARVFGPTSPLQLNTFHSMLNRFIRSASELTGQDYLGHTMVQKIALAQHFGIPTPLLDWSHSPYVAAYFAVADPRLEENSDVTFSIYALNASSFPATHPHESEEESLRDSIDLCQFIDTSAFFSRRIARQMGCFTYQTFPGCLREWLSTRSEISVPFRIYSVSGSRWQILRELELMGIVGGNLFDDMDHLARDVIMSELMNSQKC